LTPCARREKIQAGTKRKSAAFGEIMSDDDDLLPPKLLIAKVKGFPWWPALVCLRVCLRVHIGL